MKRKYKIGQKIQKKFKQNYLILLTGEKKYYRDADLIQSIHI